MDFDFVLVHAPSVYDFRNRDDILFAYLGNSDSVHVSPIFEMPPVGMLAIKQHLESSGFRVEFFNIASQMLKHSEFDVEKFFKKLKTKYLGMDLHWLAQAQGTMELARLYKEIHPKGEVLLGGISASFYHRDLIAYPQIDYVLRGADTLLTVEMLVKSIRNPAKLHQITNLTWKMDGKIVINKMQPAKEEFTAAVDWSQIFGRNTKDITPYNVVIPQYGCEYDCHWCGGSHYHYRKSMCLKKPVQKTPGALKKELQSIVTSRTGKHTVTMINFWHEYDHLIEAVQEVFNNENIYKIHVSIRNLSSARKLMNQRWSKKLIIELSPDSHRQDIGKECGHGHYSMGEMEEFIDSHFDHVHSFEIYFMIGLPKQTKNNIWESIDFCEHLLKKYQGKRVMPYLCPMLPFLDPGSVFYDRPEKYGYKIIHRSFEDHRKALTCINWKDRLNFETRWLSRDEMVDITYDSIRALTLLKMKYDVLPKGICRKIMTSIDKTKELLEAIDSYQKIPDSDRRLDMEKQLKKEILEYNKLQFSSVRSQQRPLDFGFSKKQWFDTEEAFHKMETVIR